MREGMSECIYVLIKRVRRPGGCYFLVIFATFCMILYILHCNPLEIGWVKKPKICNVPHIGRSMLPAKPEMKKATLCK